MASNSWRKLVLGFVLAAGFVAGEEALDRALHPRYPCPVCGGDVKEGLLRCPHCRTPLRWE